MNDRKQKEQKTDPLGEDQLYYTRMPDFLVSYRKEERTAAGLSSEKPAPKLGQKRRAWEKQQVFIRERAV